MKMPTPSATLEQCRGKQDHQIGTAVAGGQGLDQGCGDQGGKHSSDSEYTELYVRVQGQ